MSGFESAPETGKSMDAFMLTEQWARDEGIIIEQIAGHDESQGRYRFRLLQQTEDDSGAIESLPQAEVEEFASRLREHAKHQLITVATYPSTHITIETID